MSMRQGWIYNGVHFTRTTTERGGTRFFIDGVPTKRADWQRAIAAAIKLNGSN